MDLRTAQQLAWKNKQRKGFNTVDVPLEVCLLQGEIAEFFEAWRRGLPDIGEELADVAIYLLGLAEMVDVNLDEQVQWKLAKNEQRVYTAGHSGTMVKVVPRPAENKEK